ncbi:MAG: hypothetical protein LBL61_05740, partial [Elusimicrobiota bacterium]|nr:hypothetical protein [Elusimicrobiota bacterium]
MKTHIIKRCKKQFSAILAAALLLNTCAPAFAQYINQPDKLRVDRTQYDILAAQINKQLEATKKKQVAASRQNVSKKEISDKLKVEYQYEEYDKTGYLKQGQWKGKRKDGSARNTGFFGEIVLQGGAHSGKVITEGLVII